MKIQTLTIVAGTNACDAHCPFCVSKMTPSTAGQQPEINWHNFRVACLLAKQTGVTTALITGKGEPTLYPDQVSEYITNLVGYEFPLIELQTNGLQIAKPDMKGYLQDWYGRGLTTVALSTVHWNEEKNKSIYGSSYSIPLMVGRLHDAGLSVRLTVMLIKGYIDTMEKIEELIHTCKNWGIEQLTVREIERPTNIRGNREKAAIGWVMENQPGREFCKDIRDWLSAIGTKVLELPFGAEVFDVNGQNVCLSNCLTVNEAKDTLRQLIFFPDGHLRYSWQHTGAILL